MPGRQPHEEQWVFGLDSNEVVVGPSHVMAKVQDWFFDAGEVCEGHKIGELTATEAAQDMSHLLQTELPLRGLVHDSSRLNYMQGQNVRTLENPALRF